MQATAVLTTRMIALHIILSAAVAVVAVVLVIVVLCSILISVCILVFFPVTFWYKLCSSSCFEPVRMYAMHLK
jgi:hypothetical protein